MTTSGFTPALLAPPRFSPSPPLLRLHLPRHRAPARLRCRRTRQPYAITHAEPDACADTKPDADTDADRLRHTNAEPDTVTDAEPDSLTYAEPFTRARSGRPLDDGRRQRHQIDDSSGLNNHGTLINQATWVTPGRMASRSRWTATADYARVADHASLDITERHYARDLGQAGKRRCTQDC